MPVFRNEESNIFIKTRTKTGCPQKYVPWRDAVIQQPSYIINPQNET